MRVLLRAVAIVVLLAGLLAAGVAAASATTAPADRHLYPNYLGG